VTGNPFSVDYDHDAYGDLQSLSGAAEALRILFPDQLPASILDVGCGTGIWLRAALDQGVTDILGVDGVDLPAEKLRIPKQRFRHADLNKPLSLDRRFDLVICLEAVEHLEPPSAATIMDTLTAHGDRILFSAAVPDQVGTHHVNCQWPAYWQHLFNERGFACTDDPRWIIWDKKEIAPWYRQNMMFAVRDEDRAGREPRVKSVIHPEMIGPLAFFDEASIERGVLPWPWYAKTSVRAAMAKVRRRLVPSS
jgi:SAM-dependent methyltransferase